MSLLTPPMTSSLSESTLPPVLANLPVGSRIGVLAAEGELPVVAAYEAAAKGFDLVIYATNPRAFAAFQKAYPAVPVRLMRVGMIDATFAGLRADGVTHVFFAGKVNKWTLLRAPVFDSRTKALWQKQKQFNDDALMMTLIRELERVENIQVLPQTVFMSALFLTPGVYSQRQPTEIEQSDIALGFRMAKEMGRLDIGQTVIVVNGMVIAVEAIEGTDQAILRTRRWSHRKGGVVAKVEKPDQDLRFDVPTVGLRTLKSMRKAGLRVLAVEAGKTLVLERTKLIAQANQWDMVVLAQ